MSKNITPKQRFALTILIVLPPVLTALATLVAALRP